MTIGLWISLALLGLILNRKQSMTHTHILVTYNRTTKSIAAVTPTNDPNPPASTVELNYTVWGWDRWHGVRKQVEKKKK